MSEIKLLTVAIPTYNRNKLVLENVEMLMDILPEWANILVIDNYSTVPVRETLKDLLLGTSNNRDVVEVIRNDGNIGVTGNILRCIEHCQSEYLWIVGDDDFSTQSVFDDIYEEISTRNVLWALFYSNDMDNQPPRLLGKKCDTLMSFLSNLQSVNELVFISNNVYKTSVIKKGLNLANLYQGAMAPHLIAMISGLQDEECVGEFVISKKELFSSVSNNQDHSTRWSMYLAFLGIMRLHRVPLGAVMSRESLRLIRGARSQWLSNAALVRGFATLSASVGPRLAFRYSVDFAANLVSVDGLKAVYTLPIYFFSVCFGRKITRTFHAVRDWKAKRTHR